ncbi:N(4)-acetylcytidine aminohydrolase [Vibrio splendidus]|uniref:N(4)-acetylcytidine aminohydrolase n=1 Tax=Vibrio splendidus TaxID=29497 RepID=UPI0030CFE48C
MDSCLLDIKMLCVRTDLKGRYKSLNKITFFSRLETQIITGKKTATIRDHSESNFSVGQVLNAYTYESNQKICQIEILSIEAVEFNELNRTHARAENLPFVFILKWLLRKIYSKETSLFFIRFKVVK